MNQQNLSIDQIRIDGGTQPRESLSEEVIAQYAVDMEAGQAFPPVTVFHDGAAYWLADGFHRYHAARKISRTEIAADVHSGTRRDAILFSVGANTSHGLRRTNADKRKAVLTLLKDPEWSQNPDREIARRCAVDPSFVGRVRRELSVDRLQIASPSAPAPTPDATDEQLRSVTRGQTTYTMQTGKISEAASSRRSAPRISAKALKPIRPHSLPRPMRALSLPYDPQLAANTLYELFERSYIEGLIAALSHLLATEPPPVLPQDAA